MIKIEQALNILYQRQLSSREQLLNEMLRVQLTQKELGDINISNEKEKLFQLMKKYTEAELGFFPADREDFFQIFSALKDIDLVDFTLEIYKNDRLGTIISPSYLCTYIREKISDLEPKKILITEAEKHLSGLRKIIDQFPLAEFTLTTQLKLMNLLLRLLFGDNQNVKICFESIYTECLEDEKFDYIYTLPVFGSRPDESAKEFLTRDSDGIAMENMLRHLDKDGSLDIIVPAKITFAAMGFEKLRAFISNNFSVISIAILPEGTFRPFTSIKTYLFSITAQLQAQMILGSLTVNSGRLNMADKKELSANEFLSHEDWRIELLFSDDDQNIQKYKSSDLDKVKLKDAAEVFRGKSIIKKDTAPGNIEVLNISNIENGEINYTDLATIEEEERKIHRYQLMSGDVVLACRGTAIKSAVFQSQDKPIIASANLIVIRPKEKVKGKYIKIFLESPLGQAMIKSFQRGTTVMNLNPLDIMEMEVPLLPLSRQQQIIDQYQSEWSLYEKTLREAQSRWEQSKEKIYRATIMEE